MRRAGTTSAFLLTSRRSYTPIWEDPAPVDALSPTRIKDEASALWNPSPFVSDIPTAVHAWIRYGNDPVLDSSSSPVKSPFTVAEDYVGTNLVTPASREHLRESVVFWTEYYEKRYLSQVRQSRRTANNHIGTLKAPETFLDEADRPETSWAQDSSFREKQYLAEVALKEKVANLEQFEVALRRAAAAEYLAFHDLFGTQTTTLIPLPSVSVWHYEGDRRKAWAEKFKPLEAASVKFFQERITPALKSSSWEVIAKQVANVFREVGKLQSERYQRQLAAGIRKPWHSMTAAEKLAVGVAEASTMERQVVDGDFDAEDTLDKSEEWIGEQLRITALLQQPLGSLGFSAEELWQHTIRLEELSTEHVYTDARSKQVIAAARVALYDSNVTVESLAESLADSIEKSTLDLNGAFLIPNCNETWCKVNWAKYASSNIVHHTTTAKRQLHYHHYDSLKLVAAAAQLYFKTKPLSSAIDYSSPFKFRRSLVGHCAKYGVEHQHCNQRPFFTSIANLRKAEEIVRSVVNYAARPFGLIRRQEKRERQARNSRSVVPITTVLVQSPSDPAKAEGVWPFGATRTVSVQWPTPAVVEVLNNPGVGAEKLQKLLDLKKKGSIQVALMRRVNKEERVAAVASSAKKLGDEVSRLREVIPALNDVLVSATSTYSQLSGTAVPSAAAVEAAQASELESVEFEFVTMLEDSHPLNREQEVEITLPYRTPAGEALPQGEYSLRIRCFNHTDNPTQDVALCSEAMTTPFVSFDAVPQLAQQYFKVDDISKIGLFSGDDLVPFCQFLRDAALSVPVKLEFEVGQNVTPKGMCYFDYLYEVMRSGAYFPSGLKDSYTAAQREGEAAVRQHWELHNPGATDDEWQSARRHALDRAFDKETDWWIHDEMLSTDNLRPENQLAVLRYADDVCRVLSATECSGDGAVEAEYNGAGTLSGLTIDAKLVKDKNMKLGDVLNSVTEAAQKAQLRLCTLSAARVSQLRKANQRLSLLSMHSTEFGGRHGRTFRYAFDKALEELERLIPIEERIREPVVDRFASTTHPEQRRKRFTVLASAAGNNLDEVDPDRVSTWGQVV